MAQPSRIKPNARQIANPYSSATSIASFAGLQTREASAGVIKTKTAADQADLLKIKQRLGFDPASLPTGVFHECSQKLFQDNDVETNTKRNTCQCCLSKQRTNGESQWSVQILGNVQICQNLSKVISVRLAIRTDVDVPIK
jgi:hypothetical protein